MEMRKVANMSQNMLKIETVKHRLDNVPPRSVEILQEMNGNIRPSEVSEELDIRPQNVSDYLSRLEEIGAVEELDEASMDKRAKVYEIQNLYKSVAEEHYPQ